MKKMLFWVALFCLSATASLAAPDPAAAPKAYALQLSAYARQSGAEQAASLLKDKGLDAYVTTNQKGLFVVRAGNHGSRLEAKKEGARLKAEHIIGSFLVVATNAPEPADTTAPPEESVTAETPQVQEELPAAMETASTDSALVVETTEIPAPPAKDKREEVTVKTSTKAQMLAAFEAMANQPMAPHPPGFRAAQIALDFIGVKYRWGGMSVEKGMDCSGFVKTVYALCGINLPRTSAEQYRHGQPVKSDELAVGDMVFFGTNKRVNHVGIYLGDGKIIHAPRAKDKIRISSMEEGSLRRKFLGARRLLLGE
ncbi:MAG: NlpC/P60 family protein [Pedobacter sp.]